MNQAGESKAWQIGVFAKYWAPGRVKTRLARAVGESAAAALAREFLATLLRRLAPLPYRRVLGYAPARRRARFAELAGSAWRLCPQVGGDLGQRMNAYFDEAFQRRCQRALLLGADCPTLPVERIAAALELLDDHDVAIGPAEDGGYYLIAARQAAPSPLFADMAWGGADVLSQTLRRADEHGLSVACLPPWRDVDRFDDLQRLHRQLASRGDQEFASLQSSVESALRGRVE